MAGPGKIELGPAGDVDDVVADAAREIDDHFAKYLMVQMPKALADVRNIRKQAMEPVVEVDGIISATGERVRVRVTARGREARRPATGEIVHDVVEVSYPGDSDLWARFTAKVAWDAQRSFLL